MVEPGRIGLVRTGGFFARIIRLAQEGHWNHVVVADGKGNVYSAEPRKGVILRPEDYFAETAWLVNEPLSDEQKRQRVAYCDSQLGVPYNFWAILAFSRWWIPLPGWFVRWAARRRALICSELAVNAARASGVDLWPGRLSCTIPPAGIDIAYRLKGW